MDPYGTSFLREKWGSFQVETGVPPGRKIAIHSYTYIYIHIFYVNKYIYIYIHMFQSSKFILSMPNLSFSRICPPKNQGPVCLKRARCVTRMPCSIWPTPWMPRFYGGGDVWLGPWHCPCWIGQAMNAEDALVDLRYCTLAFFVDERWFAG